MGGVHGCTAGGRERVGGAELLWLVTMLLDPACVRMGAQRAVWGAQGCTGGVHGCTGRWAGGGAGLLTLLLAPACPNRADIVAVEHRQRLNVPDIEQQRRARQWQIDESE